jgi:hypothetical protein
MKKTTMMKPFCVAMSFPRRIVVAGRRHLTAAVTGGSGPQTSYVWKGIDVTSVEEGVQVRMVATDETCRPKGVLR